MIAASLPVQRSPEAKLLVADRRGRVAHWMRADVVRLFRHGDLVIANDAATLPASLSGHHVPSGRRIEARLAGCDSVPLHPVKRFAAVLFGAGDFRTPTEHRPLPPAVQAGDRLGARSIARDDHASAAESPETGLARIRRFVARDMGGARAARAADPVLAYACTALAVGHLDAHCRPPGCRRPAVVPDLR